MRAVRCWCGELVAADDDEALAGELQAHVAEEHPDEARSETEILDRIAEEADEAPNRPPWAY